MATIPQNNTSGLYGIDAGAIPISTNIIANNISATGNVTVDGYIYSNGSITTNSNFVGDLIGNVSGNVSGNILATTVSATGNVTGQYFIGNGSQLTGITATGSTYGNANVAAFLPTFGGNVNATTVFGDNIAIQGRDWAQLQYNPDGVPHAQDNIGTGSWLYLDSAGAAFESNTTGTVKTVFFGNDGQVNAQGNITAPYFLGNGSQLTGLPATYGNANVADFLPTYSGNIAAAYISATGNVTGGNLKTSGTGGNITGVNYANANYFVGDGSQLTNLNISNATVANAAYATQAGSAQTAGTVTIGAQGNITSVGTLSSLSVAGNITGNYLFGNGSQLTGITAGSTYSNANVTTLLASFGSNTISTSGNVTAGYFIGNGSQLTSLTGANVSGTVANATYALNANNSTYSGTVTTAAQPNITSVGTLSALSVSGNVTGSYFLGNGSQLTGLPATTPGGSNTQIQFNDGSVFAGNSNMTFDKVTGNIVIGSNYYNGLSVVPGGVVPNTLPTGNTNPSRIVIGQGYNGNLNWAFSPQGPTTAQGFGATSRFLISDTYNITSNTGQARLIPFGVTSYVIANCGNITNSTANTANSAVVNSAFTALVVGGGPLGNTINPAGTTAVHGFSPGVTIGYTGNPNLSGVGNTQVNFVKGLNNVVTLAYGSGIDCAIGYVAQIGQTNSGTAVFANIANTAAYTTSFNGASSNANVIQNTNVAGYYHPGPTNATTILASANSTGTLTTANIARMATNYYAFQNDDDLAKAKLGSLAQYHEFAYSNNSTSGSVTINKQNGQVQYIALAGNLTVSGFSNFVTTVTRPNASVVYQTDTVTLILNQGATGGYGITLPSGATYKYEGGANTVAITANTVSTVTVKGFYNTSTSATNYLLSVSSAFS